MFTSNDSLVKENAGEQVYNRVIDMEINEKIDIERAAIVSVVTYDNPQKECEASLDELERLKNREYQQKMAFCIMSGILDYFSASGV